MNEPESSAPEIADQLSDIVLVFNKKKMKIEAVKGIGQNGELETVSPDKNHQNQFMKIDKTGDFFSNFFSNFLSQLKNPTQFSFFKVPAPIAIEVADELQKATLDSSEESKGVLAKYEINTEQEINEQQKQNKMENRPNIPEASEYRYKAEDIDWKTMSNLGLNQEKLEKLKILEPLLKGYKTNDLVSISLNLGSAITRMDARLSLQQNNEGQVVVAIHGIRKEPSLQYPFFGHEFTQEDKDNLLKTGNMGRIVELENLKSGEKIPSIISIDRLTNELIALKAEKIKIPQEIKGIKLTDEQQQNLMEGKSLYLEGMISTKGKPFNAEVQFNADKRYVEFLFDNNLQHKVQQTQNEKVPKVFRGKELDDKQYDKFKAGETVYVDGLIDKKDQEYKGYITFNKDNGKTEFSFNNPATLKANPKPSEEHKTQVAVNSEGKTNEATKNTKQSLKSGQKDPDAPQKAETQKPVKARSTQKKIR